MNKDISTILNTLQEANRKNTKLVYIPSLKKEYEFYPLTAKDQKDLLEATIDNAVYRSKFFTQTYNIIKKLCKTDIVDSLTTFDRNAILIQLRYLFVAVEYSDKNFELVVKKIKEFELDSSEEEKINDESVILTIQKYPLLKDELNLFKTCKLITTNLNPKDNDDLSSLIGNSYAIEIYKYVKFLYISQENVDINIDYKNDDKYSVEDKIRILMALNKTIVDKIINSIADYKKEFEDLVRIDEKTVIEIDSNIFTT